MSLALTFAEAALFLPFVAPVCLWVVYSDLSRMKITNPANLTLLGIFVILGLIVLSPDIYFWRLVQMLVVLSLAFLANAVGLMGAGDSKFLAAAAPFIAPQDIGTISLLLAAVSACALATHRLAVRTRLQQMAPHWESWHRTGKFPFGLALGPTLAGYLALGLAYGA